MLENKLIDGKGSALDVGCNNGYDSLMLKDAGYIVTGVEKREFPPVPGITIVRSDILDFLVEPDKYNFILCNNVLPFIKDKTEVRKVLEKLSLGLASKGIFHFTLFGYNDDWSKDPDMSFYSYEEAVAEVRRLPLEILEKSTFEGQTKTMKGDIKHAEMHRFTCRKIDSKT